MSHKIARQSRIVTRYATDAVEAFTHLFRSGSLDYILHYFNDRVPLPAFEHARDVQFEAIRERHSKVNRDSINSDSI